MYKSLATLALLAFTCSANAWEEDPRIEAHNSRTAYLIKLGNAQVEAKEKNTIELLKLMDSERQKLKEISHE